MRDWQDAANCKTIRYWNLHLILPRGMDFSVLLYSASVLAGIRSQANYNAGNAYEDALARYRVAHVEKAVSTVAFKHTACWTLFAEENSSVSSTITVTQKDQF